jgi:predicted site-specific integrase-resolvase
MDQPEPDRLLTLAEVAAALRVVPVTISRWDREGKIPDGAVTRTLGGHRRFRESWLKDVLNGGPS